MPWERPLAFALSFEPWRKVLQAEKVKRHSKIAQSNYVPRQVEKDGMTFVLVPVQFLPDYD